MPAIFRYITDDGITNLSKYKFQMSAYTPLDNFLNPFWLWCQKPLPRWVSPNAITLFGLLCALVSAMILIIGKGEHRWHYLLAGFLLLVYQTADAVDGKHARITQQSTPLGGLVDHGVDATVSAIMGIGVCLVFEAQLSSCWVLYGFNMYISVWFLAQWKYYECGLFSTFGITEGELLAAAVVASPGIFGLRAGLDVAITFPWHKAPMREQVGIMVGFGCTLYSLITITEVLVRTRRMGTLATLLPLVMHHATSFLFLFSSVAKGVEVLGFSLVAMNACTLMTKMSISAITRTPWPLVHIDTLPFMATATAAAFGVAFPAWSLGMLLGWQVVSLVLMWHDIISRSCSMLGIPFVSEVPFGVGGQHAD